MKKLFVLLFVVNVILIGCNSKNEESEIMRMVKAEMAYGKNRGKINKDEKDKIMKAELQARYEKLYAKTPNVNSNKNKTVEIPSENSNKNKTIKITHGNRISQILLYMPNGGYDYLNSIYSDPMHGYYITSNISYIEESLYFNKLTIHWKNGEIDTWTRNYDISLK